MPFAKEAKPGIASSSMRLRLGVGSDMPSATTTPSQSAATVLRLRAVTATVGTAISEAPLFGEDKTSTCTVSTDKKMEETKVFH